MAHFRRIFIGMLTRNIRHAGTDSRIVLIVNDDGREALHHTFPDTAQDDQEQGEANLYSVDVAGANIERANLSNSSVRLAIRGGDAWRPEHVFVWGQRVTGDVVEPVAIETGINTQISTETNEGPVSMPLRLVSTGNARMNINRLLIMMTTADRRDAGTDSRLELQISSGNQLLVNFDLPDTPQDEQERGQANFYFAPVANPFTRSQLNNASIRLRILGSDAWRPASFFLFGLDNAAGRPGRMVPLVHLRSWNLGQLSTDSSEGSSSVNLPLV